MKELVTVYYGDDTEEELKPDFFDAIVTFDCLTQETFVTIGADTSGGKADCVALTLTKERWLELVKDVQEALECSKESENA